MTVRGTVVARGAAAGGRVSWFSVTGSADNAAASQAVGSVRYADAAALARAVDPAGVFRNAFIDSYL